MLAKSASQAESKIVKLSDHKFLPIQSNMPHAINHIRPPYTKFRQSFYNIYSDVIFKVIELLFSCGNMKIRHGDS